MTTTKTQLAVLTGGQPAITLTYAGRAEARLAFFRAAHAAGGARAPTLALELLAEQPAVGDADLVEWVDRAIDAEEAAGVHAQRGVTRLGPPQGGVWQWGTGATRVELSGRELRFTVTPGGCPEHYDATHTLVWRLAAARQEGGAAPSEGTYRAAAALADAARAAYRRAEEARQARAEAEAVAAARRGLTVEAYRAQVARETERAAAKRRARAPRRS